MKLDELAYLPEISKEAKGMRIFEHAEIISLEGVMHRVKCCGVIGRQKTTSGNDVLYVTTYTSRIGVLNDINNPKRIPMEKIAHYVPLTTRAD